MKPYGCDARHGWHDFKWERRWIRFSKKERRIGKKTFHVRGRRQGRQEINRQLKEMQIAPIPPRPQRSIL